MDAADAKNKSMKNFKNACIYAYTSSISTEKAQLDQFIAQAKVSVAAVKNTNQYKITAAKKTQSKLQACI